MANLTWRNVDAPNFSGALEGYRTASQLLGNATRSGSDAVDLFTKANSDAADRAIMQRSLGIQDSEQARRGMADGTIIGLDGANASLDVLRSAENRVGTLLNRDVTRQSYDQNEYDNTRLRDKNARWDAAAPSLAALQLAQRNGDNATANTILQTDPTIRALRADQFTSTVNNVDSLSSAFQTRRGVDESYGMTVRNNKRTIRDQNDADAAQEAAVKLQRESVDSEDAQRNFYRLSQGLSSGATAILAATASKMGFNLNSSSTGSSGGGSTVSGPTSDPADYSNFLVKLESGGNASIKSPTSSATGLHQFTKDTWLGTVKQANPAWAKGLNEEQLLAARTDPAKSTEMEATLRKVNTDLLTKSGLPVNNVNLYAMHHFSPKSGQAFAKASDDTPVKQLLSPKEVEANPYLANMTKGQLIENWNTRAAVAVAKDNNTTQQNTNFQTDIVRADGMANANSMNRRLFALENKDEDVDVLAKNLTGKDGVFAGYDMAEMAQELRALASEASITTGQAAAIMRENFVPRSVGMKIADYIPFVDVAPNTFDRARNLEVARAYKQGGLTTQAENTNRAVKSKEFDSAKAKADELTAKLRETQRRYEQTGSPEVGRRVVELESQQAAALLTLEARRQEQQSTQQLTSVDLAEQNRLRQELAARQKAAENKTPAEIQKAEEIERMRRRFSGY